jgi:hypothetical protein
MHYDQGILITKPWSPEMYAHNNMVLDRRRDAIRVAMARALQDNDEAAIRYIAKAVCAYSHGWGYDIPRIVEDTLNTLNHIAKHWMFENTWPALLEASLVEPTTYEFVGFRK